MTPGATAEQVPSCTCFSAPAAQLLLPSSPSLSLAWRGSQEAPPPPPVSRGAAPALSSSLGKLSPPASQQSGSQVPAEGGGEGKPRHGLLSGGSVLLPQLIRPAGKGDPGMPAPISRWAGRARLIPLVSWSQSRPPTELLLGKFYSRAVIY